MATKAIQGEIVSAQKDATSNSNRGVIPASSDAARSEVEKGFEEAGWVATVRTKWQRAKNSGRSLTELEQIINDERNERIGYELKRVTDARKMQVQEQYEALVGSIRQRVSEMTSEATKHYLAMADRDYDHYRDRYLERMKEVKQKLEDETFDQNEADREIARAEKLRAKGESSIDKLLALMEENVENAIEEALTRRFK